MSIEELLSKARQGDASAKAELRARAQNGEAGAQWALGEMYAAGEGLPRNAEKAAECFRLAAEQGHEKAREALEFEELLAKAKQGDEQALDEVLGLLEKEKPPKEKVWGLRDAPEESTFGSERWNRVLDAFWDKVQEGDAHAQYLVGYLFRAWGEIYEETHSDADPERLDWYDTSYYWFSQAAENGHAGAMSQLGSQYRMGLGVEPDWERAGYWLYRAARLGDELAFFNLGNLVQDRWSDTVECGEDADEDVLDWLRFLAESDPEGDEEKQEYVQRAKELLESLDTSEDDGDDDDSDSGNPPLVEAADNGDLDEVKAQLDNGADVNARGMYGRTVLICGAGNAGGIVRALIEAGADVNVKDEDGDSALMMAAKHNDNPEVVKTLLAVGADVNAKNNAGQTALDMAEDSGHAEAAELLRAAGAVNGWPTLAPSPLSPPSGDAETFTNSIGMELVRIPAGTFWMGSADDEESASASEKPRHEVTISRAFHLAKYPVTQAQWRAVMGKNPSYFKGPDRPVENVSWEDAQEFIAKLNAAEGHERYRLPTEAEWEYACRAGSETAFSFGDDEDELGNYAWYYGNSGRETHPVGQKQPNAWGLHDMHGNVYEWVQDWYGKYSAGAAVDPQGPDAGGYRVLRGGSWSIGAGGCRSAYRDRSDPGIRNDDHGFRLALSPGH